MDNLGLVGVQAGASILQQNDQPTSIFSQSAQSGYKTGEIFDFVKFEEDLKKYAEFKDIEEDIKRVSDSVEPMIKEEIEKGNQKVIDRYADIYREYGSDMNFNAEKSLKIINRAFDTKTKNELLFYARDKYESKSGVRKFLRENLFNKALETNADENIKAMQEIAKSSSRIIGRIAGDPEDNYGRTTQGDIANIMHGLIRGVFQIGAAKETFLFDVVGETETGQQVFSAIGNFLTPISKKIVDNQLTSKFFEGVPEDEKNKYVELGNMLLFIGLLHGVSKSSSLLKTKDIKPATTSNVNLTEAMKKLGMKTGTIEELKTTFKQKAKELHPDKGGNVEAFQEIANAKSILEKAFEGGEIPTLNSKTPFIGKIRDTVSRINYAVSELNRLSAEAQKDILSSPGKFKDFVEQKVGPKLKEIEARRQRINEAQKYYNESFKRYGQTMSPQDNLKTIRKIEAEMKSRFPDVSSFFYSRAGKIDLGIPEENYKGYPENLYKQYIYLRNTGQLHNRETPFAEENINKYKGQLGSSMRQFYNEAKDYISIKGLDEQNVTINDIRQEMSDKIGQGNKTEAQQKLQQDFFRHYFPSETEVTMRLEQIDSQIKTEKDPKIKTNLKNEKMDLLIYQETEFQENDYAKIMEGMDPPWLNEQTQKQIPKTVKQTTKGGGQIATIPETETTPLLEVTTAKSANRILRDEISNVVQKQIGYQPTLADISKAFKNPKILREAVNNLKKTNLTTDEIKLINDAVENAISKTNIKTTIVNRPGYITNQQKAIFQKWEDFKTPFKEYKDIKIKQEPIKKFLLKHKQTKFYLIETPKIRGRMSKAFSMMGTKEYSYPVLMLPRILKAIDNGQKYYIEPFGGVGTSLGYADSMFDKGLEKMEINFFDVDKYTIFNALKRGIDITKNISQAYDKIYQEIADVLSEIPVLNNIINDVADPGSRDFKDATIIFGFYPTFAEKFFREVEDSKIQVRGKITESFVNFLKKDVRKKLEKEYPDMTREEINEAVNTGVENILENENLFENRYPDMSNKIVKILDQYDSSEYVASIDPEKDIDKASLVAIARQLRQRGSSRQKVLSPAYGFAVTTGVPERMNKILSRYGKILNQYGDKIVIHNRDGFEFMEEMADKYNNSTIFYLDPPYVKTTELYIKNNPMYKESLKSYTHEGFDKFSAIIKKIAGVDNTLMFTNDIDGVYFDMLKNSLGNRMYQDIYGYMEGVTPTSFISTADIGIPYNETGLQGYILNKNSKLIKAIDYINEELAPDIARSLKKQLTKVFQHLSEEQNKLIDKLSKVQERQEKGNQALKDLETALQGVTSGKEKQQIINEAKQMLNKSQITGKDTTRIINKVTSLYEDKNNLIDTLVKKVDKFRLSKSVNAELKQQILEDIDSKFILKLTKKEKEIAQNIKDISEKINKGIPLTAEEQIMLADNRQQADDIMSRMSIGDMNIDEVKSLIDNIDIQITQARDVKALDNRLYKDYVSRQINKFKNKYIKPEATEILGLQFQGGEKIKDYFMTDTNRFAEKGLSEVKQQYADKPYSEYERQYYEFVERFDKIHKDLNLDKMSYRKIGLHGLVKREGIAGINKVLTYLTTRGDTTVYNYTQEKLTKNKILSGKPMTEEEAIKYIDIIAKDDYLSSHERTMYDFMRRSFEEVRPQVFKTLMEMENKTILPVEKYFPIISDTKSLRDLKQSGQMDMLEIRASITKNYHMEKGFTKEVKGGRGLVPLIDARSIALKHMNDAIYYSIMEPPLKIMTDIIEGMKEELTTNDYNHLMDYVRGEKTKFRFTRDYLPGEKTFEKSISTAKTWVLGFRIPSILIQTSALIEGKLIGTTPPIIKAFKLLTGQDTIDGQYFLNWVKTKSNVIKYREAEEYALTIDAQWERFLKTKFNSIAEFSFAGHKIIDQLVGALTFKYVYDEAIKKGLSEEKAIQEAERMTIRTIGTGRAKDLSPIQRRYGKGFTSALFAYQTFAFYRLNNLYRAIKYGKYEIGDNEIQKYMRQKDLLNSIKNLKGDARKKLVEQYKKEFKFRERNYGKFMRTLLYLFVGMILFETLLRYGYKKVMDKDTNFYQEYEKNIFDILPILRNFTSMIEYGSAGDIYSEGYQLFKFLGSKKKTAGEKASKITQYITKFSGVPGGLQFTDIMTSIFSQKEEKKQVKKAKKGILK